MSDAKSQATYSGDLDSIDPAGLVNERIVLFYFLAAIGYLLVSFAGGLIMALQLVRWNPFQVSEYLSPGRWRMIHTNAVAYVAETNGSTSVRFWIYSAGGQNAKIVLPAGYSGTATVQVETNTPGQTQTTGSVLMVSIPASTNTMLWSGT